ncbi:MFS transporter [Bogoriella caseilytica]|uniref:Putative MFS family arabinose efflux permease n=1 Tax=Bogoriella caseilytica TaxID=56055 RepID=A0A3N2BDB0_9MICO|nr:MFS transporter [Bogoriella caseilytica]ROR73034.1 putative MFS family arabinose efflux permease [Bogoriella caseilytica]
MSAVSIRRFLRGRQPFPRSVLVLTAISFTVAVGFGVMLPVLPVFARDFGVGPFAASAVVSAFAFARLLTAPVIGPLLARIGERPVLVAGLLIVAVSSAAAALAMDYTQFLIFRSLGGIGSAMFTVAGMTLLLATVQAEQRGRAASLYQGGFLLGGMGGPAIGGALATISLTAPFYFYAVVLVAAAVIGAVMLRSSGQGRNDDSVEVRPFGDVLRDTRFQAAAMAGLGQGWTSFGVRSALVPLMVVEVLHGEPSWTAVAFTVSSIAQAIALGPAGRFVDTVGRKPAMIAGGLVGAAAMAGVSLSPNIWVLTAALSVYGVAAAFLSAAPAAAVGDAAGARSGTPVAVFSMVTDLGAIVGPLVAGWIAEHGSYPLAFGVGVGIMLLGAVLALRMPGGRPSRSAS